MVSKAWHDANSEFIPVEFGYDTEKEIGVGISYEKKGSGFGKFDVFMTREEAIKLRDGLTNYIDKAERREELANV